MEPIQQIIARNLLKLRKSRNLTLEQTSELTGVSKAMLAQIENEKVQSDGHYPLENCQRISSIVQHVPKRRRATDPTGEYS